MLLTGTAAFVSGNLGILGEMAGIAASSPYMEVSSEIALLLVFCV